LNRVFLFLIIILQSFVNNVLFSENLMENKNNINNKINTSITKNDSYLIGPGDLLYIKFYGAEEFSKNYLVFNDGSVNLPILGSIDVQNLDIADATQKIQTSLKRELLQPEIFISIIKPRPIIVYLSGEINKPGIYNLNSLNLDAENEDLSNLNYFPTIIDLINNAGGFTQNANLRKIEVKRLISGKDMEYINLNYDLADLLKNKTKPFNYYLKDGDIIKIHKASRLNNDDTVALSKSNLFGDKILINVIGAVNNPGELLVDSDITLNQAILSAGGLVNFKANKGSVKLFRINNNGTAFYKKYKVNFNKNISKNSNPILKDGDIIEVDSNILASAGEGIDTILKPFLLPIYFLNR